jgi:uncharacterized protein (DUF2126 family)/transglutaminase-like putative cysteine protease
MRQLRLTCGAKACPVRNLHHEQRTAPDVKRKTHANAMSTLVSLHHVTRYRYDRPVALGPHAIRLRPAPYSRTRVPSYSLKVSPEQHYVNWQHDPHGNWIARYVFSGTTTELVATVNLLAEIAVINPFDFLIEVDAATIPFRYPDELRRELGAFLELEPAGPRLKTFLATISLAPRDTIEFLVDLNSHLSREIRYLVRMEPGVQTPEETLEAASGSCRDSAWVLVQVLRHLGLAARFVSGYLVQLKPDIAARDGPAGVTADFADLHAWAEVYLPGAGWVGFDPTSGLVCGGGHLPLAATPHYNSAAAITGSVASAEASFEVEMTVTRVGDRPRVTMPFSEDAWAALDALGEAVDRDLVAQDVRLTTGGEPTFVSVDDYQSAEWRTAPLGATKRARAGELVRRLAHRFAPGALLHCGHGKWYPGEPQPRWAFSLHWRRDGKPVWRDMALIAGEFGSAAGTEDAQALAVGIAAQLGIAADNVMPAFEDPLNLLKKEAALPINLDPLDPEIARADTRARIVQGLQQELGRPGAFVLPLWPVRSEASTRWISEAWEFRRGKMFLLSGDGPAGDRLPLGALPQLALGDYPVDVSVDPLADRAELPDPDAFGSACAKPTQDAPEPVRTALCVEPRDETLCVFLPPLEDVDSYLALVTAVEAAASARKVAVQIEGYRPPSDPRLNVLSVTPDPGVIEVNVHPATSWRDTVEITRGVYEDAQATRLGSEKYLMDGRQTGTGGGNHVVLGAAKPADSPFLRRPDLLKSIVLYWQRHPSLSYLFSGLFIGPTSQAPRVDEARHDSLHELEIALAHVPLPGEGEPPRPWLVDRLFRNLLVDVTGNTHRAEICIDKLFSPDTAMGRLGLVEFRAFEMPPDARMSLAQQLLVRALIAWFWREPQVGNCVRWGTALHDRFMLPHFVWEDFLGVLADLERAGYGFDPAWFAAQHEFRFPLYGTVEHAGARLELRQALEPWHVLGEDATSGGGSRAVDSSVERVQVKVEGLNPARYVVACNGRRVPLVATGRTGEFVAGVRFKAWASPSGLHPVVPAHVPLTFDIIDAWSRRSLGGCVYHVAHPGGRIYDGFSVNAYEAEGRRLARFQNHGHTPGFVEVVPEERSVEFPTTLDLRRPPIRSGAITPLVP